MRFLYAFCFNFRWMDAIFDYSTPATQQSVETGPNVLLDPKNMRVAIAISIPPCLEIELCTFYILIIYMNFR